MQRRLVHRSIRQHDRREVALDRASGVCGCEVREERRRGRDKERPRRDVVACLKIAMVEAFD